MKILIMGLPGAGKTTLAKELHSKIDSVWINADQVRKKPMIGILALMEEKAAKDEEIWLIKHLKKTNMSLWILYVLHHKPEKILMLTS